MEFSSSVRLDSSSASKRSERVPCQVEHERRDAISASNYVLFCLTFKHSIKVEFINERYNGIDSTRLVRWLKIKTFVESFQKKTMAVIFNIQNCQLLNLSLPTE